MILLAAALSLVVENFEASALEVSIQALVQLPHLDRRDLASAEVLADIIGQDVEGYSRRDVLTVTNGVPVRSILEPDHLRIVMSVPPSSEKSGVSLMETILRRSRISDANVFGAINRKTQATADGYWGTALRPVAISYKDLRPQDVDEFYRRIMRPDRVTLTVGGAIGANVAKKEWAIKTQDWSVPRYSSAAIFDEPAIYRTVNSNSITTLSLDGAEFSATDAALFTRILALIALGTGKGSSLFRIVREKLHFSYRQESLLFPTENGFQPRIIVAMRPSEGEGDRVEKIREALIKDIDSYSEADLARAIGMAEAVFLRNTELSPLSLLRQGPVPDGLEGRTFLRAYWPLKTKQPWDPGAQCDAMRAVTLAELKEAARTFVVSAKARLLPGKAN